MRMRSTHAHKADVLGCARNRGQAAALQHRQSQQSSVRRGDSSAPAQPNHRAHTKTTHSGGTLAAHSNRAHITGTAAFSRNCVWRRRVMMNAAADEHATSRRRRTGAATSSFGRLASCIALVLLVSLPLFVAIIAGPVAPCSVGGLCRVSPSYAACDPNPAVIGGTPCIPASDFTATLTAYGGSDSLQIESIYGGATVRMPLPSPKRVPFLEADPHAWWLRGPGTANDFIDLGSDYGTPGLQSYTVNPPARSWAAHWTDPRNGDLYMQGAQFKGREEGGACVELPRVLLVAISVIPFPSCSSPVSLLCCLVCVRVVMQADASMQTA